MHRFSKELGCIDPLFLVWMLSVSEKVADDSGHARLPEKGRLVVTEENGLDFAVVSGGALPRQRMRWALQRNRNRPTHPLHGVLPTFVGWAIHAEMHFSLSAAREG